MVWDVSFTCDVCGKRKGDANQWWMVMLGEVPCSEDRTGMQFTLMPWNPEESQNPDMYHLCGQGCALQALERFMTYGKIESDPNEPKGVRAQSTGALL